MLYAEAVKRKEYRVIRVHTVLPLYSGLFLLSKLLVFLVSDLDFAALFTLLNVGLPDGAAVLPAVLLQTNAINEPSTNRRKRERRRDPDVNRWG